jgi:UDP-N-acetylmuramoyl-L-alanyl-D-glutamate--2,6-diaminopimelate ligase
MQIKELMANIEIVNLSSDDILSMDIDDISFDSRGLKESSVFFAYRGTTFDTHEILDDIKRNGAVKCIVSEKTVSNFPHIVVKDGRKALSIACINFFKTKNNNLLKFAITGTNGKTTVSYIISEILKEAGHKVIRIGTTDHFIVDKSITSENTTPGPYEFQKIIHEGIRKGATALVAEISSHALSQDRVHGFNFDIGIFTNLSGDHLDYHKNMTEYFNSKKILFTNDYVNLSVINIDCNFGKSLFEEYGGVSCSVNHEADYYAVDYYYNIDGINAEISSREKNFFIKSKLIGEHNLSNILNAVAACDKAGINKKNIEKGISEIDNVPGRLEKLRINEKYFIIDYAHTDDALKNVLQALNKIKINKIITVFGCGGDRDKTKRPRMAKIAEEYSDKVIVTSDNPRTENPNQIIDDISQGFNNVNCVYFEIDRKKAIQLANEISDEGDIILIAGKGHEDYQILGKTKIHFDDREEVKLLSGVQ